MRLLLDTNIYVFMVSDRQSLTKDVSALIEDPENLKYLSIVNWLRCELTRHKIIKTHLII